MSASKDSHSIVTSIQNSDGFDIEWTIQHDHDPRVPAMVLCASIQSVEQGKPKRRHYNKRPMGAH
jgi:hypothetical protein